MATAGLKGDQGVKGDPGERGERGEKGDAGPIGPSDAYSATAGVKSISAGVGFASVTSLSLPAGNYLVSATQSVEALSGQATVECDIYVGSGAVSSSFAVIASPGAASVAGQATVALSATTTVSDRCQASGHPIEVVEPVLTAIKVGALH